MESHDVTLCNSIRNFRTIFIDCVRRFDDDALFGSSSAKVLEDGGCIMVLLFSFSLATFRVQHSLTVIPLIFRRLFSVQILLTTQRES